MGNCKYCKKANEYQDSEYVCHECSILGRGKQLVSTETVPETEIQEENGFSLNPETGLWEDNKYLFNVLLKQII